jgi:cytochrome c
MHRVPAAWALAATLLAGPAGAASLEEARAAYVDTCSRCHGLVTEHQAAGRGAARVLPAVMSPLGPNLTGIYGRPAGSIDGYRYSNALRKAAPDLVWDAATLDRWLTDSQAMVKGSYMFLKLDAARRALVIKYLRQVAPYRP